MASKRSQRKTISNQSQLAGLVDRTPKTISLWVRRADWPVRKRPPWSLSELHTIREWSKGLKHAAERAAGEPGLAGGNGTGLADLRNNPERMAKLQLTVSRRALLELERGIKAGEFVRKTDVEAGRVQRILAVKEALLGMGARLAPRLARLSDAEKIGKEINKEGRRILAVFCEHGEAEDQSGDR